MKDALKRVPGVADVQMFGERKYPMRLWLDPVRLAGRQLTARDVVDALGEQNVNVAAGSIGDAPAKEGQTYQMSVRAAGRLRESSDFANIIVKSGAGGSLVRLSDVGTAELGAETYSSMLRFQGIDALGFAVVALPTANALDVRDRVASELERLARSFPPGMEYRIAFDTTTVVRESISEVMTTLAEAIGLVVLVMFVFLQSWRATLIPTLTLPVSLVGAFAFVNLLGFSINTLTLFAIVLATGIVVDDAIVVIENIERHIQEHKKTPLQAAFDAMREVLGAVIATALVLIAVFVPVAFFPGTTGRLYQQFALTIAFAVAISAFNALTLTPALSALLLRHTKLEKGRFFSVVEWVIRGGTALYVLGRDRPGPRALGSGDRVCRASRTDLRRLHACATGIRPRGGCRLLHFDYSSARRRIARVHDERGEGGREDPQGRTGVESVFTILGFSFTGNAPNQGLIFTLLKPFDQRVKPESRIQGLLPRLRGPLFGIQNALVIPVAPPSIQGLGNFGGFTVEVIDQGGGRDIESLSAGSRRSSPPRSDRRSSPVCSVGLRPTIRSSPWTSTVTRREPRASHQRDHERDADLPGFHYVNDFDLNNRAYRVYVQADKAFRSNPQDLGQYYARTDGGQMVPLASVVRLRETTAPQVISHFNLFRSAQVGGAAAPGFSSGQAIAEVERLAADALPPGSTTHGRASRSRRFKRERNRPRSSESASSSSTSRSLRRTIPRAPVHRAPRWTARRSWGAHGAVDARPAERSLPPDRPGHAHRPRGEEPILIVEFAEQLRGRGLSVVEAAIEAARIRLRPILMTSLAFILGAMPLVFASGAGQEGRHSVGPPWPAGCCSPRS